MKNSRMNVSGAVVISAIAIGALCFTSGCESKPVLKDRPMIPPPSAQDPSKPAVAVQPELTPAPAVKAPAANPVIVPATVPK